MILKANYISDLDIFTTILPIGDYTVSGEPLKLTQQTEIQLKDITDICQGTTTRVVSHYIHIPCETTDNITISSSEYERLKQALKQKGHTTDGAMVFDDLEDEFNYRKFLNTWQIVYRSVTLYSDPIKFDTSTGVFDTNNEFITSLYAQGDTKCDVYVYNRKNACKKIIQNVFKKLGMEYKTPIHYKDTKNNHIWGQGRTTTFEISDLVAFGGYLSFLHKYKKSQHFLNRGTLTQLLNVFDDDVQYITSNITTRYNAHFATDVPDFDFHTLHYKLQQLKKQTQSIQHKIVSDTDAKHHSRSITELIAFVDAQLQKTDDTK
jgi:hypothetical protein